MKKRILAMLLCLCMVTAFLPTAALAAANRTWDYGENNKDNSVQVKYDNETNTLTVSGSGRMWDAPNNSTDGGHLDSNNTAPWYYDSSYRTAIKHVMVENGITSIGNDAFDCLENLESVTLPNSLTSIGKYAFYRCYKLKNVTIPSTVTTIGDEAFFYCSSLTSIVIPDSATNIGRYVFYACSGLESVTLPDGMTRIPHGMLRNCYSLASVTIPDSVTMIEDESFMASGLTSITIPKSAEIHVMEDVSEPYINVFSGCTKMTEFNVDSENANYSSQDGVLFNKNKTELILYPQGKTASSYSIPGTVQKIAFGAFNGCINLTNVTIPNSVTRICPSAFSYTGLTSVTIPERISYLEDGVFGNCEDLTSVTIPATVTAIDVSAFYCCPQFNDVYYVGTEAQWADINRIVPEYSNCPELENATIHCDSVVGEIHSWAKAWRADESHHWHECTASHCTISDMSKKAGYGEHVYDSGDSTTCTVCGLSDGPHAHNGDDRWEKDKTHHWHECTAVGCTATDGKYDIAAHVYDQEGDTCVCGAEKPSETATAVISNVTYDYSKGTLSWVAQNITETSHWSGYYFLIQTFTSDGNHVESCDVRGMEMVDASTPSIYTKIDKDGENWSYTYKPSGLAAGDYKVRVQYYLDWEEKSDAVECTFTVPSTSGGGSPSGGSSSGGSTGGTSSGGSSGSNTTTTTEKNPDGSTTTITENKTTGTVTETTKNTDGSQTVVETKKDGTVTTTETDKEGNKTETVEKPDGSSVTKVAQKDGTTATVTTDTDGKTEAEVKLPAKAVADAQEKGETVALPIPEVTATRDAETAPVVTVKTGSKDEVKVDIPTANATPGTVAVIVNADGTEEVIKTSIPTENGVAVSLPDGAMVKIVDNSKSFADVPAGNWAADAVSFSTARELFSGTSETTFAPEAPMTRAMMMTVLARFDGEDTSGGSTWYEKGQEWAVANGVSDGTNPNSNITREQLAIMLWRYSGSPAPAGGLDQFTDAGSVSSYAQDAMRWAVENGIISGYGNGQLGPKGLATRAQVAQMLKNFISAQ